MPSTAYLSLGSNLGVREQYLRQAITQLANLFHVVAVSHLYETEPVEYLAQPNFLNCAVVLETDLTPRALLARLRSIEHALGRPNRDDHPSGEAAPKAKLDAPLEIPKGPRTIDLDILLFDALTLHDHSLTLPHPAMHQRRFVLAPLAEIAPDAMHPTLRRTAAELLSQLPQGPPLVEQVESKAWNRATS